MRQSLNLNEAIISRGQRPYSSTILRRMTATIHERALPPKYRVVKAYLNAERRMSMMRWLIWICGTAATCLIGCDADDRRYVAAMQSVTCQ